MFTNTLLSQLTTSIVPLRDNFLNLLSSWWWEKQKRQNILVFFASAFLVSIPVFFQAPLVRIFPWLSLLLTLFWFGLSFYAQRQPHSYLWGDILWGFSWSWLCGSIYWGWLRYNPAIHIPIEAIGLPFALWCLSKGWSKIGNYFYLGSLLGTAITDLYFYIVGLIPYWQEIMVTNPTLVKPILQGAIAQVQTVWGISWAVLLANVLLGISLYALVKKETHYIAFAGAVLATIFTDALFLIVAYVSSISV
ncbi:MAG: DUF3120 domain-containing protein [Cyanobacteria bacterium]|uniref:DUF3120 domain-containing protein n=1 Tax=Geminocystis sp. TaxID=2664100 RepID=UPI001DF6E5E1|nr:DUF3120 domain-containing protein [Cyanobacteria bacterium CG_2015-16_32_12]NCO78660.1 DUF3120 domain-containing protein [Cyanobacteria bacterium CG_2015-22_32_23]NCQ04343.1 DUF3120 domain-containing protein [Cyanobacteria bacterium CG_2015-09_32_10]NCQ42785.1 DUF3120 domain-containing protein [Cyanobacteria bacterium CG_2015-04_32_10]NCS84784.1 DUF3120 domain-containing protein [Cyanobacteria bacterium CG_2015-02_32_10]